MEAPEFKEFAKTMVDFIADYFENLRDRRVLPDVKVGYMSELVPETAPDKAENWQSVMEDVERVIMPGMTHWQSPKFLAYYPVTSSYPSVVADMLSAATCCLGFSWISSPACTELEIIVLDWMAKMIDLPKEFHSGGKGGGVIQNSASEAALVALLTAKAKKIHDARKEHPDWTVDMITAKLVAYTSEQAHSCIEKAGLLTGHKMRLLPTDKKNSLRGETLEAAIKEDLANGLIPFFSVFTLGTTGLCSFDRLDECGAVSKKYNLWVHVDAAYAGAAFICPEYRYLMRGVEYADSFDTNPHKWLMVGFDCSCMWLKDSSWLVNAFKVEPAYLKNDEKNSDTPEFRHWTISLSRRFRALKLWFVLRLFGVENLQAHIRKHCNLAKKFEALCKADERFEIFADVVLGLVCFRLKGSNELNENLVKKINERANIHLIGSVSKGTYFVRMVICSRNTTAEDIDNTWKEICTVSEELMPETCNGNTYCLTS